MVCYNMEEWIRGLADLRNIEVAQQSKARRKDDFLIAFSPVWALIELSSEYLSQSADDVPDNCRCCCYGLQRGDE